MIEGYSDNYKQANANWWLEQVYAGQDERKILTREGMWSTYRQYYRNRYSDGVFPKNMFFVMKRSLVPRVYFRNPKISILPKKPGAEHKALAAIMQKVDNSLLNSMRLKEEMKLMVDRAFTESYGVQKLVFGAEFTPTPTPGGTSPPVDKRGVRSEYRPGIVENQPFVKTLRGNEIILPKGIKRVEDTYMIGHWIWRYRDDVYNDPRFPNIQKLIKKTKGVDGLNKHDPIFEGTGDNPREIMRLLEIRDRRTRKVMLFAPDDVKDREILMADDEMQTDYSSPFFFYVPNPDDDHPYGVSDASILVTFQEQLNEINTRIYEHARLGIARILAEQNALTPDTEEALLKGDVLTVVKVAKRSGIEVMSLVEIPEALLKEKTEIMEDMREVMGFSRNAMAQFQARSHGPTATEVEAVKAAAELRVDERRDILSDHLTRLFRDIHLVIFRHWTREHVERVVGPNGVETWVRFTGAMLREGEYEVQIEPDTSVSETAEVRQARAEHLYQLFANNPRIDQDKLVKHVINETRGVSLEDLMLDQTPGQGAPVLNPQQFARFNQTGEIPPQTLIS